MRAAAILAAVVFGFSCVHKNDKTCVHVCIDMTASIICRGIAAMYRMQYVSRHCRHVAALPPYMEDVAALPRSGIASISGIAAI